MSKEYKSYEELLDFLQNEKNLVVDDTETAKQILTKISYFGLITGYKETFKNSTTGKYKDGTKFSDIYALYCFDNELRSIFLKYILIAERSVKSSMAYHFSEMYGERQEQYLSLNNYDVTNLNRMGIRKLTDILSWQLTHRSDYKYIEHYKNRYENVPLWIMIQVLTLGQVSHMFDYLKSAVAIRICKDHKNISKRDMHSFLSVMTKHRNVCAHGDRFFNYVVKDSITDTLIHRKLHIPREDSRYKYGKNDVFAEVIILKYLLDRKDFHDFYYELKACIKQNNLDVNVLEMMGFPDNWQSILRIKC